MPSAAAPSERDFDSQDAAEAACTDFQRYVLPPGDAPTPEQAAALKGCDAEDLYFGNGRPVDDVAALHCAYAHRSTGDSVLMKLYANGRGVKPNYDAALLFACELGGPELGPILKALWRARQLGHLEAPPFDDCDYALSSMTVGVCATRNEHHAQFARAAREQKATAGMPAAPLAALKAATTAFFDAHLSGEVDQSGLGRLSLEVGERAAQDEDFVARLEDLARADFTPHAGAPTAVEAGLNAAYQKLMKCPALARDPGAYQGVITRDGIRAAERLFLPYREAWVALARQVHPELDAATVRAWITEARAKALRDLVPGC